MNRLKKKGQVINGLTVAIGAIAGLAILLAITLYVLVGVAETTSGSDAGTYGTASGTTTVASNATETIITKLATAPVWIGILIIVIFASAILYFWRANQG